jgi:hypothetical protein
MSDRMIARHSEGAAAQAQFDVFLAYADVAHERLGKKYCERLSADLTPVVGQVTVTEWKFEMLTIPAMSEMAAVEAEAACMVIIATSGGAGLPSLVKMWLERWCSKIESAVPILVVILSECQGCSKADWPDYSYLEAQTKAWGIELVVYASGVSPEESDLFCLAEARKITANGLIAVEDFPEAAALANYASAAEHQ